MDLNNTKTKHRDGRMIAGFVMTGLVLLISLTGLFWTPYDPMATDPILRNAAPSFAHPFGCDNLGRDVFSRVMDGASVSFTMAFLVVAVGTVIGSVVGALTGYFGSVFDAVLMRINDALAAFPNVLVALVFIAVIGNGRFSLVPALGVVFIPSYVRVVRGEVKKQKELDYVKNLKLMGASGCHIIFADIFPNIRVPLISSILIGFQNAVLAEAGMSYLGLGVMPNEPSLGRMLSEAQSYLLFAPWYAAAPGLTILLLTLGLGFVSHGLNER